MLVADQIVGSGAIEARGGSCNPGAAAGGGGRISLPGDSISEETLVVDADGGGTTECDAAKGQPGTIHAQCRTASCSNGGYALFQEMSVDASAWNLGAEAIARRAIACV